MNCHEALYRIDTAEVSTNVLVHRGHCGAVRWDGDTFVGDAARPVIVVTNPDDDVSPAAFHALLDDILAGPNPSSNR